MGSRIAGNVKRKRRPERKGTGGNSKWDELNRQEAEWKEKRRALHSKVVVWL